MATSYAEGTPVATEQRTFVQRIASETKPSFKTTELIVLILSVAGVLVASSRDDSLDGQWAWTLVAALAIGYMISRGLAKAGSHYAGDE